MRSLLLVRRDSGRAADVIIFVLTADVAQVPIINAVFSRPAASSR